MRQNKFLNTDGAPGKRWKASRWAPGLCTLLLGVAGVSCARLDATSERPAPARIEAEPQDVAAPTVAAVAWPVTASGVRWPELAADRLLRAAHGRLRIVATGVIVAPDGIVATTAHEMGGRSNLVVRTGAGEEFAAVLILQDLENDWALLQAPGLSSEGVMLRADHGSPAPDTRIYCMGFAAAFLRGGDSPELMVREGRVQSRSGVNRDPRHLQLVLPIGGGFSGSPVLDESGAWIGMVSDTVNGVIHAVTPPGSVLPGTNFILKADWIERQFPAAVRGRMRRRDPSAVPVLDRAEIRRTWAGAVVMIRAELSTFE